MSFFRRHHRFFSIAIFLGAAIGILYYVDPAHIVAAIGVRNIYAATFLLAVVGGVSALTATSFYAAVFAFALGGANPFLLALFAAPGVLLGDAVFWYLGHHGKAVVRPALGRVTERISRWVAARPPWIVPAGAYLYSGFIPLPGEFLMVALALLGIPFKRILVPTLLGNYTLALIVALSAAYGITFAELFF